MAKAGTEKNISPHTLRHSFATDLYREKSKIHLVQKVLGHSDLSTTMIYTHIHDPEVEEALESFRQATAVAAQEEVLGCRVPSTGDRGSACCFDMCIGAV